LWRSSQSIHLPTDSGFATIGLRGACDQLATSLRR
jgi:hypothetical protein